jgi:hypothetical protein
MHNALLSTPRQIMVIVARSSRREHLKIPKTLPDPLHMTISVKETARNPIQDLRTRITQL